MNKSITVFTTTYNRAYTLPQLYESLLRQTSQDFMWLIVDDGSSDNTRDLVQSWINSDLIPIKYIHQQNTGMLGGHNTAYDHISTELNVCIDSDDYMPDNAIERILDLWNKNKDKGYAGLLGLDAYKNGDIIGTEFPNSFIPVKFSTLKSKHKVTGDKKFVYRTDIINEFPRFPVFKGEKFPAAGWLYRLIDKKYDLLAVNEVFCIVEYMEDGNSKNKFSQYKRSPNAFAFYRIERMRLATSYLEKFKNAVHYVSSCLYAKRSLFKDNPYKLTTLVAVPFGTGLFLYLKFTSKKGVL